MFAKVFVYHRCLCLMLKHITSMLNVGMTKDICLDDSGFTSSLYCSRIFFLVDCQFIVFDVAFSILHISHIYYIHIWNMANIQHPYISKLTHASMNCIWWFGNLYRAAGYVYALCVFNVRINHICISYFIHKSIRLWAAFHHSQNLLAFQKYFSNFWYWQNSSSHS